LGDKRGGKKGDLPIAADGGEKGKETAIPRKGLKLQGRGGGGKKGKKGGLNQKKEKSPHHPKKGGEDVPPLGGKRKKKKGGEKKVPGRSSNEREGEGKKEAGHRKIGGRKKKGKAIPFPRGKKGEGERKEDTKCSLQEREKRK